MFQITRTSFRVEGYTYPIQRFEVKHWLPDFWGIVINLKYFTFVLPQPIDFSDYRDEEAYFWCLLHAKDLSQEEKEIWK